MMTKYREAGAGKKRETNLASTEANRLRKKRAFRLPLGRQNGLHCWPLPSRVVQCRILVS
ncbi:hypothetical protein EH228_14135 [Erwinia endophytica]|nr:hypothetical protein EH228_14135 [Erwinia endophytica]